MRSVCLTVAAVVMILFCGCDGEMWISTGDDGWTSDFNQPWAPTSPAAASGGTVTSSKRTGSDTAASKSDTSPAKAENLGITLAAPVQAKPGEDISVNLTVKNSTDAELSNLMVEGVVPSGLKVTDASGQVAMRWRIRSLAAGESKTLTATLKASSPGSYRLSAHVTADGGKIASANADVKVNAEPQPK